jgi:hypothetical protein
MVVDPYPSFNGVAIDSTSDLVMMSDTNRKSLLVYDRTAGSRTSRQAAAARQQIMGPDTGVGFVAGVAMDPAHRELLTVNNDVEDRLVGFDSDARGNVNPKRMLYVPHQSWGIAFAPKRDVMALSVQTPNMFVVFDREILVKFAIGSLGASLRRVPVFFPDRRLAVHRRRIPQ